MRPYVLLTVILLGSFAALLPLPHAGTRFISGVAYAPSHNESATPDIPASEDRIRQDLTLLSAITPRIRTYSIENGMERVPAIARELHMKVSLGIWLGPDKAFNQSQITKALAVLRGNADTVDRVFVGNETLLRHDLDLQELKAYLRTVKQGLGNTPIEVTTGETWGFWLKYPELAEDCDVIGAHILPYWDGYPVAEAVRDIVEQVAALRAVFPGKTLVIAETGWPSRGQTREGAVPSEANQQLFLRAFLKSAADTHLDYYIVEAFDQPWKASFEGEVGQGWGLFDSTGQPKFDFSILKLPAPPSTRTTP